MNKFNLIENAKDSLIHAMSHIGPIEGNGTGDWKRIILDFSHIVELLFKEKLRIIHPAFVFQNIDKYPSINAFTVTAELSLKRLQKVGGLEFSKKDLKAIETTRKKRNEIEHYEFSITDHEATVLVGQTLSFILRFSDEHLGLDWKSLCLQEGKWEDLSKYTEFYEDLLYSVNNKIDDEYIEVIICTSCSNDTFSIEKEECLLCGYKEEIIECESCNKPYLFSDSQNEYGICKNCEWQEGYALAHCEKY